MSAFSEVTDIFDDFPGTYFKATELVGKKPMQVTIVKVEKAEMSDGKSKPVVFFREDDRGLVLNQGNREILVERFGRDPRKWAGKTVTLVTRTVNGPKGRCPGIRFADLPLGEEIDEPNPVDEPNDSLPGDWAPFDDPQEVVTPTPTPAAKAAVPRKHKPNR